MIGDQTYAAEEAYNIAVDYVAYVLYGQGSNNVNTQLMVTVGNEIEKRYLTTFGQLNINEHLEGRENFFKICHTLFCNSITWTKIVAMYVYIGKLAFYYNSTNRQEIICDLPNWMLLYTRNFLCEWIVSKNGWISFTSRFSMPNYHNICHK